MVGNTRSLILGRIPVICFHQWPACSNDLARQRGFKRNRYRVNRNGTAVLHHALQYHQISQWIVNLKCHIWIAGRPANLNHNLFQSIIKRTGHQDQLRDTVQNSQLVGQSFHFMMGLLFSFQKLNESQFGLFLLGNIHQSTQHSNRLARLIGNGNSVTPHIAN